MYRATRNIRSAAIARRLHRKLEPDGLVRSSACGSTDSWREKSMWPCRGTVVRRRGDRVFGCPEMPGERNRVGADVEGLQRTVRSAGASVPRRRDTKLKSATRGASPEPVEDLCRRQRSLGTDPQISNPKTRPRA